MDRAKVTFFISSMEQGGAERQLAELLTRLDKNRFETSLVVCIARDHLGYPLPLRGVHCLNAPYFPTPISFWQLVSAFKSIRPDIVHTYMGWQNTIGRLAARSAGVKTVIGSVRATRIPLQHLIAESVTRSMVDAIIVNSVGIRDELIARARPLSDRIYVIENGVDLSRFVPLTAAELHLERNAWGMEDRRTIVVPGRICEQKNQLTLVRAIAAMKKRGALPSDARFLLAGRNDHLSYGTLLRALIISNRLSNQIELLGVVSMIERLIAAADGVLLASHFEGLPNAVIEAMACRVPVIVSPAANTDKLITDGVDGIVCSGASQEAIARALERFFDLSAKTRTEMGSRGLEHVRRRFTVQRMVEETTAVYDRFLEPPRAHASHGKK